MVIIFTVRQALPLQSSFHRHCCSMTLGWRSPHGVPRGWSPASRCGRWDDHTYAGRKCIALGTRTWPRTATNPWVFDFITGGWRRGGGVWWGRGLHLLVIHQEVICVTWQGLPYIRLPRILRVQRYVVRHLLPQPVMKPPWCLVLAVHHHEGNVSQTLCCQLQAQLIHSAKGEMVACPSVSGIFASPIAGELLKNTVFGRGVRVVHWNTEYITETCTALKKAEKP